MIRIRNHTSCLIRWVNLSKPKKLRSALSKTVSKEFMRTFIRFSGMNKFSISLLFFLCLAAVSPWVYAQDNASVQKMLAITQAAMCEKIKDYAPQNRAVVFSIAIGKVFCFTSFDPVPEEYVYLSQLVPERPADHHKEVVAQDAGMVYLQHDSIARGRQGAMACGHQGQ